MAGDADSIETKHVGCKVGLWEQKLKEHRDKQLINPFSEWEGASHRAKLALDDENYGKPVEGSKTKERGERANELVSSEIIILLKTIKQYGSRLALSDVYSIKFGALFELYTKISNKVVGILLRARKHKLVEFEGEMLFQGRHDDVIIYLTKLGNDLSM